MIFTETDCFSSFVLHLLLKWISLLLIDVTLLLQSNLGVVCSMLETG